MTSLVLLSVVSCRFLTRISLALAQCESEHRSSYVRKNGEKPQNQTDYWISKKIAAGLLDPGTHITADVGGPVCLTERGTTCTRSPTCLPSWSNTFVVHPPLVRGEGVCAEKITPLPQKQIYFTVH